MTHIQRLSSLNGALIKWAREDAGFDEEEVSQYCGIKDADTLKQVEFGVVKLTTLQAEKLTRKLNRPLAFFYLDAVPPDLKKQTPDNRSSEHARHFTPKSLLALRRLYLVQEYAEDLKSELKVPSPTIPSAKISQSPSEVAAALIKYLGITDLPRMLHRETALNMLAGKIEDKGVLVVQLSMPRTELQGASLYSPVPIILVNHSDYRSSQIFTLMHELTHLCLRSGGTCVIETEPSKAIEQFCNQVAGEMLVPKAELTSHLGVQRPLDDEVLNGLADYFSVSREVVLLRLIQLRVVNNSAWDQKVPRWRQEIDASTRIFGRASPVTKAIRENGHQYARLVNTGISSGVISPAEASRYLNVRGGILQDVLGRI